MFTQVYTHGGRRWDKHPGGSAAQGTGGLRSFAAWRGSVLAAEGGSGAQRERGRNRSSPAGEISRGIFAYFLCPPESKCPPGMRAGGVPTRALPSLPARKKLRPPKRIGSGRAPSCGTRNSLCSLMLARISTAAPTSARCIRHWRRSQALPPARKKSVNFNLSEIKNRTLTFSTGIVPHRVYTETLVADYRSMCKTGKNQFTQQTK